MALLHTSREKKKNKRKKRKSVNINMKDGTRFCRPLSKNNKMSSSQFSSLSPVSPYKVNNRFLVNEQLIKSHNNYVFNIRKETDATSEINRC